MLPFPDRDARRHTGIPSHSCWLAYYKWPSTYLVIQYADQCHTSLRTEHKHSLPSRACLSHRTCISLTISLWLAIAHTSVSNKALRWIQFNRRSKCWAHSLKCIVMVCIEHCYHMTALCPTAWNSAQTLYTEYQCRLLAFRSPGELHGEDWWYVLVRVAAMRSQECLISGYHNFHQLYVCISDSCVPKWTSYVILPVSYNR